MRSSTCRSQLVDKLLELLFLHWFYGVSSCQTKKLTSSFFKFSIRPSPKLPVFSRDSHSHNRLVCSSRGLIHQEEKFIRSVLRCCKVQNYEVYITFELICCSNTFCKTTSLVFTAKVTIDKFCWTRKVARHFLWFLPGVCTLIINRSQRLQIITKGFDNQAKLIVYVVFLSLEGGTIARFPTC